MKILSFLHAGAGAAISQVITFLAMPVLFRLYAPADFAPWAVALAIVTLVGGLATLRYELAVVVEQDHTDASALFWLSFILALAVGVIISVILVLPPVGHWLFRDISIPLLGPMMAIWLLLIALISALQGWVLHRGAFMTISLAQIGNAVIMNAVQFIGGYTGGGARWLIIGSILGQGTLFAILLASVMRPATAPAGISASALRICAMAAHYRRFPLLSVPFTLCTILRERAAIILLGSWVGPAEIGYYSQAWRIMSFPVGLSGSAIRPVVFHAVARQGLLAQEARIGKILTALVVTGAPWLALILYRPEDLFAVVLGESWRNAGAYAAIFSVPVFLFVLSNWMDRILDVVGRQDLNLLTEFLSATTSIAALVITLALGGSILTAVVAQSAVLALNYALFIVIAYRVSGYSLFVLVRLSLLLLVLIGVFLLMLRLVMGDEGGLAAFASAIIPLALASAASGWMVLRRLR